MRARNPLAMAVVTVVAVLAISANWANPTTAATVSAKWGTQVKVGARSQGSATLFAYSAGSAALSLRLTGLRPYATYSVGLYAGTCSTLGTRAALLPVVTSTAGGTVTRGLAIGQILAGRLKAIIRRGHLSVAIGSTRRCGTLARIALSPTPTPTPTPDDTSSPTPVPSPSETPPPTPSPTPYVYPAPSTYMY
jgi:hypothetical protein